MGFPSDLGLGFSDVGDDRRAVGEPDLAVDFLLMDAPNNQFGLSGMNPRVHLGEAGFVRDADTYFPSNGSLLAAVAMMAAGRDGAEENAPGFPADWVVRHEGPRPLPDLALLPQPHRPGIWGRDTIPCSHS